MTRCCSCPCPGDHREDQDKIAVPENPMKLVGQRGCTDVLCLLMFATFWMGMFAIALISFQTGDIYQLRYGHDHDGNRCGINNIGGANMTLRTKTFYPRLNLDVLEQSSVAQDAPWKLKLYGLCVEECPMTGAQISERQLGYNNDQTWESVSDTHSVMNRCIPVKDEVTNSDVFCAKPACDQLSHTPAGNQDCVTDFGLGPQKYWRLDTNNVHHMETCQKEVEMEMALVFSAPNSGPIVEYIQSTMSGVNGFFGAVNKAQTEVYTCGLLVSFFLGIAWIIFLRCFARFAVYLLLVAVNILMIAFTMVCFWKSGVVSEYVDLDVGDYANITQVSDIISINQENQHEWQIASFIMAPLTIIMLILVCSLRRSISICIAIVEEASSVIKSYPMMLFFPTTTILTLAVLIVYTCGVGAYIGTSSATELAVASNFTNYSELVEGVDADDVKKFMALYHLFGFLWTNAFIQATAWTILCGCSAHWYFRRDSAEKNRFPLLSSIRRVLRFHLGTMAFGSLIIALVQAMRGVLEYVDKQTQDMQDSNLMMKMIMKCAKCFLWCLEKFAKFITGYCYIYVALDGSSLCSACMSTFKLFISYPAQVAVNAMVQNILYFVQSLTIPMVSGYVCYNLVEMHNPHVTGHDIAYPAFVAMVLAYVVARAFGSVYESIVDTLFICSFLDKTHYEGRYMTPGLRQALDVQPPTNRKH